MRGRGGRQGHRPTSSHSTFSSFSLSPSGHGTTKPVSAPCKLLQQCSFYVDIDNDVDTKRLILFYLHTLGATVVPIYEKRVTSVVTDRVFSEEVMNAIIRSVQGSATNGVLAKLRGQESPSSSCSIDKHLVGVPEVLLQAYRDQKKIYHTSKLLPWLKNKMSLCANESNPPPTPPTRSSDVEKGSQQRQRVLIQTPSKDSRHENIQQHQSLPNTSSSPFHSQHPYVYIEDLSGQFPPLYKEFPVSDGRPGFPCLNLNSAPGASPFHNPKRSSSQNRNRPQLFPTISYTSRTPRPPQPIEAEERKDFENEQQNEKEEKEERKRGPLEWNTERSVTQLRGICVDSEDDVIESSSSPILGKRRFSAIEESRIERSFHSSTLLPVLIANPLWKKQRNSIT